MILWYLMRALGMVALLVLTASTTLGALATLGRDPDGRLVRQLLHRTTAVVGLVALLLHIVTAVVDSYVAVPLSAALLPFGSGFRPVAMAIGVLGCYALAVTALSGWLRGRLAVTPHLAAWWRTIHASAYAAWVLSMAHGLLSGTDTHTWWGTATYAACGLAVAAALVVRAGAPVRRVPDGRGHLRLTTGPLR